MPALSFQAQSIPWSTSLTVARTPCSHWIAGDNAAIDILRHISILSARRRVGFPGNSWIFKTRSAPWFCTNERCDSTRPDERQLRSRQLGKAASCSGKHSSYSLKEGLYLLSGKSTLPVLVPRWAIRTPLTAWSACQCDAGDVPLGQLIVSVTTFNQRSFYRRVSCHRVDQQSKRTNLASTRKGGQLERVAGCQRVLLITSLELH